MFWELCENLRSVLTLWFSRVFPTCPLEPLWVLEKSQVAKCDGLLCEDFISETVVVYSQLTTKMPYQICTRNSAAMVILGTDCSVVCALILGLSPGALHSQDLCCKELLNIKSTIFLFYEKYFLWKNHQVLPSHRQPDTQDPCRVLDLDLALRL